MFHPGIELSKLLREKGLTQKDMATLCGKNSSELNELIKGKRNFTIQRDLILHTVLGTPEQFWTHKQTAYEYEIAKQTFDGSNLFPYQKKSVTENESKNKQTIQVSSSEYHQVDKQDNRGKKSVHHDVFEDF